MGINRREFIKLAGLSALLGLGGKSAFELVLPGEVEAAQVAQPVAGAKRWAMVVDMRKLNDRLRPNASKPATPSTMSPITLTTGSQAGSG